MRNFGAFIKKKKKLAARSGKPQIREKSNGTKKKMTFELLFPLFIDVRLADSRREPFCTAIETRSQPGVESKLLKLTISCGFSFRNN